MKAITLTQPWATLVARGAKRIETRGWRTSYTGPIAIHAAKGFPWSARGLCLEDAFYRGLFGCTLSEDIASVSQPDGPTGHDVGYRIERLPRGAVVATARLVACEPTDSVFAEDVLARHGARNEWRFGDYSPGRWMWLLTDVVALAEPVSARGALSLWEWTPPELAVNQAPGSAGEER